MNVVGVDNILALKKNMLVNIKLIDYLHFFPINFFNFMQMFVSAFQCKMVSLFLTFFCCIFHYIHICNDPNIGLVTKVGAQQ